MADVSSPLDPAALEAYREERAREKTGRGKSREVCVCGHAMNHHNKDLNGRDICTPGNTECKCNAPRAILTAENLRMFMHKTAGAGTEHALGRGILASLSGEYSYAWVEDPLCCDKCRQVTDMPYPIAISELKSEDGQTTVFYVANTPQKANKVVCFGCFSEMKYLS